MIGVAWNVMLACIAGIAVVALVTIAGHFAHKAEMAAERVTQERYARYTANRLAYHRAVERLGREPTIPEIVEQRELDRLEKDLGQD